MAGNNKRGGGRPSSLTPDVRSILLHEVEAGSSKRFAAQSAGITERSLYNYLRRGAQDTVEGKKTVYAEFFQSYQKAEAVAVADLKRQLIGAKAGEWQKFAWLLERQWPAEFGAASARKVIDDGFSTGDSPLDRMAEQIARMREERAGST